MVDQFCHLTVLGREGYLEVISFQCDRFIIPVCCQRTVGGLNLSGESGCRGMRGCGGIWRNARETGDTGRYGGYAQRDLSLWKPIVEAIAIWLVGESDVRGKKNKESNIYKIGKFTFDTQKQILATAEKQTKLTLSLIHI